MRHYGSNGSMWVVICPKCQSYPRSNLHRDKKKKTWIHKTPSCFVNTKVYLLVVVEKKEKTVDKWDHHFCLTKRNKKLWNKTSFSFVVLTRACPLVPFLHLRRRYKITSWISPKIGAVFSAVFTSSGLVPNWPISYVLEILQANQNCSRFAADTFLFLTRASTAIPAETFPFVSPSSSLCLSLCLCFCLFPWLSFSYMYLSFIYVSVSVSFLDYLSHICTFLFHRPMVDQKISLGKNNWLREKYFNPTRMLILRLFKKPLSMKLFIIGL